MLTYRTGAAGAPSASRAMSEHLMQQTLSPEMAEMARYYQQGLNPPTPAEAAAARYAAEASAGRLPNGELLDAIVAKEADRLADNRAGATVQPLPRREFEVQALGTFVAAGLVDRTEAAASLRRLGHGDAVDPEAVTGARLEAAVQQAGASKDYSSATATPRRDMNPALAQHLGIDTGKALTPGEVANLGSPHDLSKTAR